MVNETALKIKEQRAELERQAELRDIEFMKVFLVGLYCLHPDPSSA